MPISRTEIVNRLTALLGADQVITDEETLKLSSVDRFRRYEELNGVFMLPIPAAVVYAESAAQVSEILSFANEHRINVVPRTGRSASPCSASQLSS